MDIRLRSSHSEPLIMQRFVHDSPKQDILSRANMAISETPEATFCAMCGMPINFMCRVSIDVTADEFANIESNVVEQDDFREISILFYGIRRNINHVHEMEVCGISRIEIDRECLFFYVKNKSTPTRTIGIANKVRFFLFGWDTSFAFMFLPLFVYSTFERSRPSFHSRWTHKPENGKRWTWILEKDFRPPVYFNKGFYFRLPRICMYFYANPERIKVTEWLQKLRIHNVHSKRLNLNRRKKPEFRNDRIFPLLLFFPFSTFPFIYEIYLRRGSFSFLLR